MGTVENPIQREILNFLTLRNIFCWRANSISRRKGGSWVKNRGVGYLNGVADIIGALPDGRILAIEAKGSTGKLSEEQVLFLENINASGGLGIVAMCVEDVEKALAPYLKRKA